ncbi:helix-turn-helix domain-containing protein [Plantactinospora solaniradicis]|uniref:Helix-turn-helix domain-containing protein n=1 Tax=Plantactinospora solaniradicis TaxID=1723736 RepID=A0ABW1KN27_9ACTN
MSATEVSTRAGISRVTARRYLEHLVSMGRVSRNPGYGAPGRPEMECRPR